MELKFNGLSEQVEELRNCGISGIDKPLDVVFIYDTVTDTMISSGLYFGDMERLLKVEDNRYKYGYIRCKSTKELSEDLVKENILA